MTPEQKQTLASLWALMVQERCQDEIQGVATKYLRAESSGQPFRPGVRRQISATDPVCPACAYQHDLGLGSDIGSHHDYEGELECHGCGVALKVRTLVLCVTERRRR